MRHIDIGSTINSGIYIITNRANGHQYVGSAVNIDKRWAVHRSLLRRNNHNSRYLQNSWNKYGKKAFEFRLLGTCAPERLIELEQEVMNHLKPQYNVSPTAASKLGLKHSPETRAKLSTAQVGNKNSLGCKHSPERRAKQSARMMGNKNALGHKVSPETRNRISTVLMGHKHSSETRVKIGVANKRRKVSPETRNRMSAARIGHKVSFKTRNKISATKIRNAANVILMTIADESAERNSHTYETDLLSPQKILQG